MARIPHITFLAGLVVVCLIAGCDRVDSTKDAPRWRVIVENRGAVGCEIEADIQGLAAGIFVRKGEVRELANGTETGTFGSITFACEAIEPVPVTRPINQTLRAPQTFRIVIEADGTMSTNDH